MNRAANPAAILALARRGLTNTQIAEALACTVRTIDRRRAADPELNAAIIAARAEIDAVRKAQHGTVASYSRGCHCLECKAANTRRCYEDRMRRRERLGLPLPDPNRGRRSGRAQQPCTRATIGNPSMDTRIAQAIARGEPTSQIMRRLGCEYKAVQSVRADLVGA